MKNFQTFTEVIEHSFQNYGPNLAVRWRPEGKEEFETMTYSQLEEKVKALALALIKRGVKHQEHIGLIADVSHYWLMSNLAIQLIGAVDVPRGTDSTAAELGYIINHAECSFVFVHNGAQIEKIEKGLEKYPHKVQTYIVLNDSVPSGERRAIGLSDLLKEGLALLKDNAALAELKNRSAAVKPSDLATIVYTSGTTGEPKGVMLTQSNFASQLNILPTIIPADPSDRGLTLLPPWHVFGRIAEMLFFTVGASITYTDIKHIGEDLKIVKPTYVPAVPRIWEGVYNKIIGNVRKQGKEAIFNKFRNVALAYRKNLNRLLGAERLFHKRNVLVTLYLKLISLVSVILLFIPKKLGDILVFRKVLAATGGHLKASISGGGALPGYVDDFFAAIGVKILEGYGLTETSPVLAVRRPNRVIPGTVGPLIPQTEMKLIDLEGRDVTNIPGAKGTLYVRGPQVMQGYYKNPQKTKEVLSDDGWFNTGDLVRVTITGELSIVGRSKDTLVLVGGENVEPTPIEEKLKESDYIDHVMCVSRARGEDQKYVGALIVINEERVNEYLQSMGEKGGSMAELRENPLVKKLIQKEIQRLISTENGFKSFEKIGTFAILPKPFEPGDELNNTLKVKRHVVAEKYADIIDKMYAE
ncbi:MAG: AMP-binding protein [Leptospiraceae bacterium]|nr:AMP-binding protein [Leptospiraceae bacterium]